MDQKPLTDEEQKNVAKVHKKAMGVEPGQVKMSTEEYVTHMEGDLRKRTLAEKPLTEVQTKLEELVKSPRYEAYQDAVKVQDPEAMSETAESLNAELTAIQGQLNETASDLPGDLQARKDGIQRSIEALRNRLFGKEQK